MINMRNIGSIVKADLIERTRSYGFLVTIAISIIFACIFIPPADAKYAVVMISGYRGIYNSAWIGATVAMSTITTLSLFGYFLVKSAIDKDRQTGVGQIIATTPLKKLTYIIGKFLSNFLILLVLVFITFVVSIIMQLIRGEVLNLNFIDLCAPLLVIVVPSIALVAAIAILFESVSFLKGGIGNIIYFFFWGCLISYSTTNIINIVNYKLNISSPMGSEVLYNSMVAAFQTHFPGNGIEKADGFLSLDEPLKSFIWNGVEWDISIVVGRAFWFFIALVITFIASILFKGFDRSSEGARYGILNILLSNKYSKHGVKNYIIKEFKRFDAGKLTPVKYKFSILDLTVSELKLALKGLGWWWYLVQGAFIIACIISPLQHTKSYFGPLSWCWPLLIWSSMGVKEIRNHTHQIIFSSPYPIRRQFTAAWFSGLLVTLLTGSGMLIKFLISGNILDALAWVVGAMFIPTLAFMLGIWTHTSKTFEVIFLVLMFVGVLNNVLIFDFIGIVEGSIDNGMPIIYLFITIALALVAYYGRRRQIKI